MRAPAFGIAIEQPKGGFNVRVHQIGVDHQSRCKQRFEIGDSIAVVPENGLKRGFVHGSSAD